MPIFDKATARVVAVIVLLIVIATALRGYLPGVERSDRQQPPHSGGSVVYVAALLSISLVIVAASVIARLRDPRQVASSARPLPRRMSGGSGRPAWQVLLIGAAVLALWLVLLLVLSRFIDPHVDQPQTPPQSSTSAPPSNTPQRPDTRDGEPDRDVLHYLIVGTVALLVVSVAGAATTRRRRVAPPVTGIAPSSSEPASVPAATSLVRAAESGLAEIEDPSHEPRQAIIACYAAMERGFRRIPGAVPQDFDTPTEVLARAVEHHALHIDNAAELVSLFEEARFSPHVMTETHRGRAIDVLQLVLAELRSSV
ncbi:DUF4129 domain-containing protein [Mycobacterium paraterrae]|uniref:DUF4129 domain-containing protein n=1 Tax=Mycobacterium paraterrae TaxID=577492 RepID=A0ABY3VXQ5_9MYCO|nr:DUF4129 domain-containing protein [Mycobacterium paraterrae]UMB72397.1 DUF4129 domain-containing protein [Mycobacterium paraterrae]